MARYDKEIEFLTRVESHEDKKQRTVVSASELQQLALEHPGIPLDYLDYLAQVGAGSFRNCQYTVYGEFFEADEILGPEATRFGREILCFGDNFSGDPAGFMPSKNWAVVELWHDDLTLDFTKKTFHEFIRDRMLMGPSGEDLRSK
jgi:hypothetical protein